MKKKLIPIISGICCATLIGGILIGINLNKKPSNKTNDDPRYQIYLKAKDAGYEGTYEEWLSSIRGDEVELRVADNYIQMKYKKETTWANLISLDALKGKQGESGTAGVSVKSQLQVNDGYIQFKNENETTWTNLIALTDLTGDKGEKLELNVNNGYINYKYENDTDWVELIELSTLTGSNGKDGKEVTMSVESDYIVWKYNGETNWNNLVSLDTLKGDKGATGDKGEKSMMQVSNGFIQWKNENDTTWTNLVSISTLTGSNGKEVTMSVEGNYIVWKYVGDDSWNNLISINDLKGDKGDNGEKALFRVNEDGYLQYKYESDTEWTDLCKIVPDVVLYIVEYNFGDGEMSINPIDMSHYDEIGFLGDKVEFGRRIYKPQNPTAPSGYVFDGWFYNDKKWDFTNDFVTCDMILTASYVKESYNVILENDHTYFGYVTGEGTYEKDSTITIKAITNTGYTFDGWYDGETLVSNDVVYSFTMPNSDITYTAKWTKTVFEVFFDAYPGELAFEPEDLNHYSKVGFEGDLVEYGGMVYEPYDPIAPSGYVFDGWYYYDLKWSFKANVVTRDMYLEAHYVRSNCNLSLDKNNSSAGYVFGKGTYEYDSSVTIVAITNPGYTFDGWYDGETLISTDSEYTFTMPNSDVAYTAHWTTNKYKIIVNSASELKFSGVVSGTEYEFGKKITLRVTNNDGGNTIKWSRSDGYEAFGDTYEFNVPNGNLTITISSLLYTREDNHIYFGKYPQTLVTDEALVDELNVLAGNLPVATVLSYNWTTYQYKYSTTTAVNMFYQDIDYDNDGSYDYRGIYFKNYRPHNYTLPSNVNNSYQDDNGYYTSTTYWFSYDPIEWDILTETSEKILIISHLIIDSQEIEHNYTAGEYEHNGGTGYNNNYELSSIRQWLNDDFYNTAFNDLEKAIIKTTLVDNGNNSSTYASSDTNDNIFLLAYSDELDLYYSGSEPRLTQGTSYAKAQGLYVYTYQDSDVAWAQKWDGNSPWWLRTPKNNPYNDLYIDYSGQLLDDRVYENNKGIRPVCWINA